MSVLYTCEICGKECEGHFNSRYCPECRAKRRTEKRGPDGKPTQGQIAAKARSLHMSYGQYVAKYGL